METNSPPSSASPAGDERVGFEGVLRKGNAENYKGGGIDVDWFNLTPFTKLPSLTTCNSTMKIQITTQKPDEVQRFFSAPLSCSQNVTVKNRSSSTRSSGV
jgi:hypothetical protein